MPQSGRVPVVLIFEFLTGFNGTNISSAVCKKSLNVLHKDSAVRFFVNKLSQLNRDIFEVGIVPFKTVHAWTGV